MKKILILIISIGILILPICSYGAATVEIKGENLKLDETGKVEVIYSGKGLGRVDAVLKYDQTMLAYVSGGTNELGAGQVELKLAGTGEDIVFPVNFKAIGEGTAKFEVHTREMYDVNEVPMASPSTGRIEIQIEQSEESKLKEIKEEEQGKTKGETIEEDKNKAQCTNMLEYYFIGGIIILAIIALILIIKLRRGKK